MHLPFAIVPFTQWQQLGLAFLLGSFTVATLSDLRRLSAQREFVEIWGLFALLVLGLDIVEAHKGIGVGPMLFVKWGMIAGLSVASLARVGWLFRLAAGDVAALAAAASLLEWWWVPIYYAIAKVLSWWLGPLLSRGRSVYPFMPVVSLATIVVLALVLVLGTTGAV
jgi:hypothetical protein